MTAQPEKPTVFICYSHEDEEWRKRLSVHLRALEQQGYVVLWDDRKIGTGDDWFPAIRNAIANAAVAVCLISPDFLASDFINKEEIPALLERRKAAGMLLLPIFVRPCAWECVRWLSDIQMFPDPKTSLASLRGETKKNEGLAKIAIHVFKKIKDPSYSFPRPSPIWAVLPADHVDVSRLPQSGSEVFGRDAELALLDQAWESEKTRVISFVAWGGVGKSALVNKWVDQLQKENFRGAQRVYAWSFYSQGTGQRVASGDMFIDRALRWFGDTAFADTNRSAWDKGKRLAELVQQQRTLLLLDGLEPLQSGFQHDRGDVQDPGVCTLVKELCKKNAGLCVITTREALSGFKGDGDSLVQKDPEQISADAGRSLFRVAGVRGTDQELEQATRDFGNHALAVNLLAAYLQDTPGRRIEHARLIPDLSIPDNQGRHPRRVLEVFARKFEDRPELGVLNIMGFFDRPASAREILALRTQATIPALTDRVRSLTDPQWEQVIHNLRSVRLIAPSSHHDAGALDAHPLVREHFGRRLKETNFEGWRLGHRGLYEHLRDSTKDKPQPTLEDLHPLYQAVAHGCLAGLQQKACAEVYYGRIQRGNECYSTFKLGAIGADLGAIACFFEQTWSRVSSALSEGDQAWLLNEASFSLRALGRTTEALEPMRLNLKMRVERGEWQHAPSSANNLSGLELNLGMVPDAIRDGEQSVAFADRADEWRMRTINRTTLADALHQAGRRDEARKHLREAERLQAEWQPQHPRLYSLQGFRYCDLLLAEAERAAWCLFLNPESKVRDLKLEKGFREVEQRAAQAMQIAERNNWLLDIAHDHLMLGRAAFYRDLVTDSKTQRAETLPTAHTELITAVDGLRLAGVQDRTPLGLLSRAWVRSVEDDAGGARADLDEASEIAERGPMRLFMADIHLCRARLFYKVTPYPWVSPKEDLAAARRLIEECGYHRRDEELADAERAIL